MAIWPDNFNVITEVFRWISKSWILLKAFEWKEEYFASMAVMCEKWRKKVSFFVWNGKLITINTNLDTPLLSWIFWEFQSKWFFFRWKGAKIKRALWALCSHQITFKYWNIWRRNRNWRAVEKNWTIRCYPYQFSNQYDQFYMDTKRRHVP